MTITIVKAETIGEIVLRRSDMDPEDVRRAVERECRNGLCTATFRTGESECRFHNRPSEIILNHARAHKSAMQSLASALEQSGAAQEEV